MDYKKKSLTKVIHQVPAFRTKSEDIFAYAFEKRIKREKTPFEKSYCLNS